jgi:hypothetical protein
MVDEVFVPCGVCGQVLTGVIFSRDTMSGMYAACRVVSTLSAYIWMVGATHMHSQGYLAACRALALAHIIAVLDVVAARPAFRVPLAPPAVAQRAARQPLALETMPDAMAAYVLEPLP